MNNNFLLKLFLIFFVAFYEMPHGLALNFVFTRATNTTQNDYNTALPSVTAASQLWTSRFTDNVTVNLTIGFTGLGQNILAQAGSSYGLYNYNSQVRPSLLLDATSSIDASVNSHLQLGSVGMLLNRNSNNPNGSGSGVPYFDNDADDNNNLIRMTTANAKALGLLASNNSTADADITFSNAFSYDFDQSNGITPGQFDLTGVFAHEIGHALGFTSGVDILDGNSPPINGPFLDSQFTFVSTADLFRFSTQSRALGDGVIDWTADTRDKYFSLDGGATKLVSYSTGINFGDGQQASHWKDNLGIGIMDPTAAPGELLTVSDNDVKLFDAIGWDTTVTSIPEPGTYLFWAAALCFGSLALRKKTTLRIKP